MVIAAIFLTLLFTIDNLLIIFFPLHRVFGEYQLIPYLLLMGICVYTFFAQKNHAIYLALIFGLIYDIYSANVLGLYITIFPLIALFIKKYLVEVTPINFISIFYVTSVAILIVELVVYLFVIIITSQTMSIFAFIQSRLLFTLLFNTLLLAIFYLPMVKTLQFKTEKKSKES